MQVVKLIGLKMALLMVVYNVAVVSVFCQDTVISEDIEYQFIEGEMKAYLHGENLYSGVMYSYSGVVKTYSVYVNGCLTRDISYQNDVLYFEQEYNDNCESTENGFYKEWDSIGNLLILGNFRNGERQGIWRYYKGEYVSIVGAYDNDLKNGPWHYRDENGDDYKREIYGHGELISTAFYKDGKWRFE